MKSYMYEVEWTKTRNFMKEWTFKSDFQCFESSLAKQNKQLFCTILTGKQLFVIVFPWRLRIVKIAVCKNETIFQNNVGKIKLISSNQIIVLMNFIINSLIVLWLEYDSDAQFHNFQFW